MVVDILESLWPKNKAKGLLAQTIFVDEIAAGSFGPDAGEKVFQGCWLVAPQEPDFYRFRSERAGKVLWYRCGEDYDAAASLPAQRFKCTVSHQGA